MKTSSCKAKGRRAAQEVKDLLHSVAPGLKDGDIWVTPSGVTGPDIQLSPLAQNFFDWRIEVKNQEAIQIWAALEQAKSHAADGGIPVLFFRRNHSPLYVAVEAKHFVKMVTKR